MLVLGHRIAASSKTHEAYAIVRERSRANANARSAVHSARRLDEHQRRTMPLSLHVELSKSLRTRQRRTVGLKERASHGAVKGCGCERERTLFATRGYVFPPEPSPLRNVRQSRTFTRP